MKYGAPIYSMLDALWARLKPIPDRPYPSVGALGAIALRPPAINEQLLLIAPRANL